MLGVPFFICFQRLSTTLSYFFFFGPESFSIDSCKLKRNSERDIAKQKGLAFRTVALTRVEAEAEAEVPSASASCEPNSTCKPFCFPLYYFHTPQSCPVDEEVDLLDHGRAAAN